MRENFRLSKKQIMENLPDFTVGGKIRKSVVEETWKMKEISKDEIEREVHCKCLG